jgi:anti-sigma regulatory factor (Ser/Thr protein kinase)
MAGELLELRVACDERAPATVRGALAELPEESPIIGDAMLVASELVTNAVRHSGCRPDDVLDIAVTRQDEHLLISVRDPGASGRTAQLTEADAGFGGLGLRIVELLADRWGHERDDGYRVWARLPLADARVTVAG